MNNINKNGKVINFKNFEYILNETFEIISNDQVLIDTNDGFILFDLSCTINEVEFTDINLFVQALTNEA